eukprot:495294-Alexandrium_andersonii.AAC.1
MCIRDRTSGGPCSGRTARRPAPTGCPTSSSTSAATSLRSSLDKPSTPAGWATNGWRLRSAP